MQILLIGLYVKANRKAKANRNAKANRSGNRNTILEGTTNRYQIQILFIFISLLLFRNWGVIGEECERNA